MTIVDARGLRCPYPVVRLGRAATSLPPGSEVRLLSDDPVSRTDVPAWCRLRGATLVGTRELSGYWEFTVVTAPAGGR